MPLEDLGRLVLAKRTKLGLGVRGAAKEIGISHPTLARVEKGLPARSRKLRKNPQMARRRAGTCAA